MVTPEPSPTLSQAPTPAEAERTPGTTTIADTVVAQIAGIAARAVQGVHALGGGSARIVGAIRETITTTDLAQGVAVTVDDTHASVDVIIVVEYPNPVHQVAEAVRAAITAAITTLIGMEVVEVNIEVDDIHVAPAEPEHNEVDRA